jgi:hypothetical protein
MRRPEEEGCKMIVKKIGALMVAGALALTLAGALPASAKAPGVTHSGACSMSSHWKLKVKPDNGRIQAEFEVDSNVNGQTWHVRITDNGTQILSGNKVTHAPSGSFTVRKLATNRAGVDRFRAVATYAATGERCVGTASI